MIKKTGCFTTWAALALAAAAALGALAASCMIVDSREIYTLTYNYVPECSWAENPNPPTNYYLDVLLLQPAVIKGGDFEAWYNSEVCKGEHLWGYPKFSHGNKQLWGAWTPHTYIITYHRNEADSGALPDNQVKTYGTPLTLPGNEGNLVKVSEDDYRFTGWNTRADGAGTTYEAGGTLNDDLYPGEDGGQVILYARWGAIYDIVYDANGADSGTPPDSQTRIPGTPLTLQTNSGGLVKGTLPFGGWNTQSDGTGTNYAAGAVLTEELRATPGTAILYALWGEYFTITYHLDGGTNGVGNPAGYITANTPITLSPPAKSGAIFGGWFTDSGFTSPVETPAIPAGSTGNKEFWVKWTDEGGIGIDD